MSKVVVIIGSPLFQLRKAISSGWTSLQPMENSNAEALAVCGGEFLRCDGTVRIVKGGTLLEKVRAALLQVMAYMTGTVGK